MEEQHLHIAGAGQTCAPATVEALFIFLLDGLFHTLRCILATPRGAERRILDDKPHLGILEAVCLHGVLVANVLCVLALDHHLGQADGIRFRVDLLTKQAHVGRRVIAFDEIVAGGEHTARSAGLVQYGDDFAIIEDVVAALCQKNIDHQLDDVPAGVVVASLGIFRKLADQVFKNIAHLHVVDGARI